MNKPKISLKQKVDYLEEIVRNTFWMARRYAHGRQTYAPSMVRQSYRLLKKYFPHLVPHRDCVLDNAINDHIHSADCLHDCND